MDLLKIGKFIGECRKKKNFTQMELAEKLNITDRAISKWERGKSLPDASIMLKLCKLLEISVNELLSGEVLNMKDYNEQSELNLIELKKQKEESDRRLLRMEVYFGALGIIVFLGLLVIASFTPMEQWLQILIFVCSFVEIIEQKAGYYECSNCHHKFIPTYKQINFAMHMGRTRFMKCPKCGQKSWCKKVVK